MRLRFSMLIWFVLFSICCIGCSDLNIFSKDTGGATETTNGIVFSSTGQPLANAKIKLIANVDWLERIQANQTVILDSAITDKNGAFHLQYPDTTYGNLQIVHPEQGLFKRAFQHAANPSSIDDTVDIFKATPISKIIGTANPSLPFHTIQLEGTSITLPFNRMTQESSTLVPSGVFNLSKITPTDNGWYFSFIGRQAFTPGTNIQLNSIVDRTPAVLLDDFTDMTKTTVNRINNTNIDEWYTYTDSDFHPSSEPSSITMSRNHQEDAYTYRCLFAKAILRSGVVNIQEPFVGIGCFLGNDSAWHDLSKLTALSFMAKGQGRISVQLESKLLDTLTGQENNHYKKIITLTDQWTHIQIPIDSLNIPDRSPAALANISWAQIADKISRIEFVMTGWDNILNQPIQFWLDDIYLHGIGYEDIN